MTHDATLLQVFEPPMCCSTGVCGPDVDPALVAFAGDVRWLIQQGLAVIRYTLSRQPDVFVDHAAVFEAISDEGLDVLPLLVLDGRIVSKGRYPARHELATFAGLNEKQSTVKPRQTVEDAPARTLPAPAAKDQRPAAAGQETSCCGDTDSDCC